VEPPAAAAVAGGRPSRNDGLAVGAAILLRRGEGPTFLGVLRARLEVGVGRVAFAKPLVALKVNGKLPAPHPVHLVRSLLPWTHPFTLVSGQEI